MKEGSDLDMTFSGFVAAYTRDMQSKLKHNTWFTKETLFLLCVPDIVLVRIKIGRTAGLNPARY